MIHAAERARNMFRNKEFLCAESVLLALAERAGVESELLPGIASGFCSGLARTSGMCGAVSGAVMALGMLHGRQAPGEPVDEIYGRVQALILEFCEVHESIHCRVLLGCDLGTPEGREAFQASNLGETRCERFIADAVRLALLHSDLGLDD